MVYIVSGGRTLESRCASPRVPVAEPSNPGVRNLEFECAKLFHRGFGVRNLDAGIGGNASTVGEPSCLVCVRFASVCETSNNPPARVGAGTGRASQEDSTNR